MKKIEFDLFKLFAATTYSPFMEKIISNKDNFSTIKDDYQIGLTGITGMYEFRSPSNFIEEPEGKVTFNLLEQDPNFFKLNPDRLELQAAEKQTVDKKKFIERFSDLNVLHKNLFNNRILKLGLVCHYQIQEPDIMVVKDIFKISDLYFEKSDNCKTFLLLKRDGFNINIEFLYQNLILTLRIDINDILNSTNDFNFEHFDKILELHEQILRKEIYDIYGGLNG